MKAEAIARVDRRGRVTIPREIRRALRIGYRNKISFFVDDDGNPGLHVIPRTVEDLRGIVPALPGGEDVDIDEIIREAMEERAEQIVARMSGETPQSAAKRLTNSPRSSRR